VITEIADTIVRIDTARLFFHGGPHDPQTHARRREHARALQSVTLNDRDGIVLLRN
jgi:hypothetical protein